MTRLAFVPIYRFHGCAFQGSIPASISPIFARPVSLRDYFCISILSTMSEIDPLILSYSHLADFPRAKDALQTLKKIASLVKPIMRARGWKVQELTEFYPNQQNLLGLNVNAGQKICLRLRYPGDRNQFLPVEQVTDTMLHELAHNVHGPHDAKFHALWNQLRDEHESLAMKGYTGEGFLSDGKRLGGRRIPMEEARRLARAAAEKRRVLNAGSGQRLGGAAPRPGQDIRKVIVDAVERRNRTLRGCANDNQTQDEIREIADTATQNGFRTQAEEDAANEAAIAQALWELVQEEEKAKKGDAYIPPTVVGQTGDRSANNTRQGPENNGRQGLPGQVEAERDAMADKGIDATSTRGTWTCEICTLENPENFLCCDACTTERSDNNTRGLAERSAKRPRTMVDLTRSEPEGTRTRRVPRSAPPPSAAAGATKPVPQTWTCGFCGRVRERQWWSCDMCGTIKGSSA
ncbi:WLM-domain-containing protein [Xylariomycetidae sp. FL2044]|nr:WLM-domain-containing protein [Xylariomycetidae sp. FL2044]